MRKRIIWLWLLLASVVQWDRVQASHVLGGDLTYRCLGSGNFRFTLTMFRDCAGAPWNLNTLQLQGPVSGTLTLVSSSDVSPRCPGSTAISCNPPSNANSAQGAVARFVYTGVVNLTGLGPAPVGTGYTFFVAFPCCRPGLANMFGSDQALQVKMFRYVDPITGIALSPAQICDNSPTFISDPTATIISNPFDTIYYQNFALDPDLSDSTSFGIDFPLSNFLAPYAYTPPYSSSNPLPGMIGPPVVAPANSPINPASGEMVFNATTSGTFVTVIRVSSFRCGQLISQVFRDFSLKVIPTPGGSPPPYNPNLDPTAILFTQRAPSIQPPKLDALNRPIYELTYYARDTIDLLFNVTDIFPALIGNVNNPATWNAYPTPGFTVVFNGNNLSPTNNPADCPQGYAPCATVRGATDPGPPAPTLTPPTQILNGNGTVAGIGYSTNSSQGGARFVWRPDCSNLPENAVNACGTSQSGYQFSVTATDFNCPVVGREVRVYTFNILNLPRLEAPKFFGVSATSRNDSAILYFRLDLDTLRVDPIDSFNFLSESQAFRLNKSVNRRKQSFTRYRVYRSTSPTGPFVKIDSLDQLYTYQYVDRTVNLSNNTYYYYLTTVSSCGDFESEPSDTLKVISLSLNNNVLAGRAELRWDSTAVIHRRPYFPNATGNYVIEREIRTQTPLLWERVDTVQDLYLYNQNIVVCDDTVFYRVGLVDTNGTIYWSMVDGDRFRDIFPPDSIIINHVSADSVSGQPVLSWQPGPSTDVIAYIVYRLDISVNPPLATLIDTVWGYNNTYWIDAVSGQSAWDSSLHYGIAGLDSCGNLGLISRRHSTIHLSGGLDQCISSIVLNWTDYKGWDQVENYEIYRSEFGGPWNLLATVPAGFETYQYIDNNNLITDSTYCYAIAATRSNDDTIALSNDLCVVARVIMEPTYSYIRSVTVDSSLSLIRVKFAIDTAADAGRFELLRATSASDFRSVSAFTPIDMQLNGGFLEYNFVDQTAEPDKEIYYYRVMVYDLCDQLLDTSNTSNSIYLQATPEIDFFNRLRWNSYASWLAGVDRYEVLRFIPEEDPGFLPLNTVGANSVVYADDIKDFTDNDGRYRYLITAYEGAGNPAGFNDTAMSNVIEVIQQPRVYMPTAFKPLGINRLIFPKGVFIEERRGYNFEIYNRWGEMVYNTNDISKGWDGKHLATGEYVDPGVYVFVLNFIGKNGKSYSQNGTFTVIR